MKVQETDPFVVNNLLFDKVCVFHNRTNCGICDTKGQYTNQESLRWFCQIYGGKVDCQKSVDDSGWTYSNI